MKNLNNLERRVTILERPNGFVFDPDVTALDSLNDTELGLVEEMMNLAWAGFDQDMISEMMGAGSYQAAIAVIEKADAEYKRLNEPTRPKRRGKPLKVQKEPNYDEGDYELPEDAEA